MDHPGPSPSDRFSSMAKGGVIDLPQLQPIGFMHTVFQYKNGTPRQPALCSTSRGSFTIEKSIFNNPEHALEGLEQFSHAWILFVFHLNKPGHSKAKVRPPRLNGQRVGVFSTRSPHRPNAIGLTLAKIEQISGATVHFSGLDIVDGTPVIDIKPYIPQYDAPLRCMETFTEPRSVSKAETKYGNVDAISKHSEEEEHKAFSALHNYLTVPSSSGCFACCNLKDSGSVDSLDGYLDADSKVESAGSFELCDTLDRRERNRAENGSSEEWHCEECSLENKNVEKETATPCGSQISVQPPELRMNCVLPSPEARTFLTGNIEEECTQAAREKLQLKNSNLHEVASLDANYCVTKQAPYVFPDFQQTEPVPQVNSVIASDSFSTKQDTRVAQWVAVPPVRKLKISFTPTAESQLKNLVACAFLKSYTRYNFDFLSGEDEIRMAITSVLMEDPRSVYRREKCRDALYFFSVDRIHVTCWFDEDRAEVVRVQHLSHADRLVERTCQRPL